METQDRSTPTSAKNRKEERRLWKNDIPEIPDMDDEADESNEHDMRQNVRNDRQQNQNYLTKEDLPDATNESTGKMGSGQRQDSN
jgi:hypothetical protein